MVWPLPILLPFPLLPPQPLECGTPSTLAFAYIVPSAWNALSSLPSCRPWLGFACLAPPMGICLGQVSLFCDPQVSYTHLTEGACHTAL